MALVTIAKAAEILGCSKANVYQRIKRQGIPTKRVLIKKRFCTTREVFALHVDLDLLKGGTSSVEIQDSERDNQDRE